ncbi:MAG: hypothetical protein J0L92_22940 [Deltaproteobacteria bacterium]|nr:hypothetical protein [Deltaproteobacteria bacterium]
MIDTAVEEHEPELLIEWKQNHERADTVAAVQGPVPGEPELQRIAQALVRNVEVSVRAEAVHVGIANAMITFGDFHQNSTQHFHIEAADGFAAEDFSPGIPERPWWCEKGAQVWQGGGLLAELDGDDGTVWALKLRRMDSRGRPADIVGDLAWDRQAHSFVGNNNSLSPDVVASLRTRLADAAPRPPSALTPLQQTILTYLAERAVTTWSPVSGASLRDVSGLPYMQRGKLESALDDLGRRFVERWPSDDGEQYSSTLWGVLISPSRARVEGCMVALLRTLKANKTALLADGMLKWSQVVSAGHLTDHDRHLAAYLLRHAFSLTMAAWTFVGDDMAVSVKRDYVDAVASMCESVADVWRLHGDGVLPGPWPTCPTVEGEIVLL